MRLLKKTFLFAAIFSIFSLGLAGSSQEERVLDDFKSGLGPGWEDKSFAGKTGYTVEINEGRHSVKAISRGAASGLIYKIAYDPKEMPILRWSWKIERILAKGDERSKAGDDYAARVDVIFPSLAFWRTKALNYIWANKLPKGEAIPNAFTGNAVMIAVESGNTNAGRWINEERNILADYRKYFKSEPPEVGAIAIMTDTDNTGESAVAWYGPISIARGTQKPATRE